MLIVYSKVVSNVNCANVIKPGYVNFVTTYIRYGYVDTGKPYLSISWTTKSNQNEIF